MYWINQNLTCQASRVTIKKITRLKLGNLDYDMIIGLPFIQRYQPQVNWRTGKLKFKKFSWAQEPELFQRAGINIIAAAEIPTTNLPTEKNTKIQSKLSSLLNSQM